MFKISMLAYGMLFVFGLGAVQAQEDDSSQFRPFTVDGIVHTIAPTPWNVQERGNHRAIVSVTSSNHQGVKLHIPWRRPDQLPEKKKIVVIDAATGKEVKDVWVSHVTNESGELAFRPETVPGKYEIYYLPYRFREKSDDARYGQPWNDYLPPVYEADASWLKNVKAYFSSLPEGEIVRFESRTSFDFFTPMDLLATEAEAQKVTAVAKGDFMVFPEDRAFPIRLTEQLPVRWTAKSATVPLFQGTAAKNEYYTFQLGLLANKRPLKSVKVIFSDLVQEKGGARIAKDSLTCFNQEGIDWKGKPVRFQVDVPQGHTQALWIGLSVPANAASGNYRGWATVQAEDAAPQKVQIRLQVTSDFLADRGDADLWRHARLRWLNSTLGISHDVIPPFHALQRRGDTLRAGDKTVVLDPFGLPRQVSRHGRNLFSAPMALLSETEDGAIVYTPTPLQFEDSDGEIRWHTDWEAPGLKMSCKGSMAFDGTLQYTLAFYPQKTMALQNAGLKLDFKKAELPYLMGIGYAGGNMPTLPYSWNWKGPWDSFWIGSTEVGLHVEFGGLYNGPLLNDYKPVPPPAWANQGAGSVQAKSVGSDQLMVYANTGQQNLNPGKPLELRFKLLLTPVKELDPQKHFAERYYQGNPLRVEKAAAEGANVINIHHNTELNPYINYPFIVRDSLQAYVARQHAANRRVKLYYTIRELSNHAVELYALSSLGEEIFPAGPGQGTPWLWEHLHTGYKAAWYAPFPDQTSDASIVMNGFSRWINYYIEGLRWMLQQDHIDGLYLDDVAYDREVIERLRRVLLRYNPDALLDLHSNTNYSVGPANQYMAFFPYLDRLWFGESFKYNQMRPDEWLVQFSGIPFGLMSEMLQDDGNKWLGMVYGTTVRHSWGNESPAAIWKYWDTFQIGKAKMWGYWDSNCPVKSDNPQVKITVYQKPDTLLLAIGNFSDSVQYITPIVDAAALPFPKSKMKIRAREIAGFQEQAVFEPGKPIPVAPKQGWLLEVVEN